MAGKDLCSGRRNQERQYACVVSLVVYVLSLAGRGKNVGGRNERGLRRAAKKIRTGAGSGALKGRRPFVNNTAATFGQQSVHERCTRLS